MANSTDTSSLFRILTIIAVFALLVAAALVWLRPPSSEGSHAELAALSQAIPDRAQRAVAGAEGGDAGVQGFGIIALKRGDDFILVLAGIEIRNLLFQQFAEPAGEGMPELDLGLRLCHADHCRKGHGQSCGRGKH